MDRCTYHCVGGLLGSSESREDNEEGRLEVHCEWSIGCIKEDYCTGYLGINKRIPGY